MVIDNNMLICEFSLFGGRKKAMSKFLWGRKHSYQNLC